MHGVDTFTMPGNALYEYGTSNHCDKHGWMLCALMEKYHAVWYAHGIRDKSHVSQLPSNFHLHAGNNIMVEKTLIINPMFAIHIQCKVIVI
jgi:hypothetical protein